MELGGKRGVVVNCEGDDLRIRMVALDLAGRLYAADTRHADVHQYQIGLDLLDLLQRLFAAFRLTDHLDLVAAGEDVAKTGTHQFMIIDQ